MKAPIHKTIFSNLKDELKNFVFSHLHRLLECYKENPDRVINAYMEIINENFLTQADYPNLYVFLLAKLSLSEYSEKFCILSYQAKKLKEAYDQHYTSLYHSFSDFLQSVERDEVDIRKNKEIERYYFLYQMSVSDEKLERLLAEKLKSVDFSSIDVEKIMKEGWKRLSEMLECSDLRGTLPLT
ncbi:MAG: hypothetical protein J7K98_02845 [Candidatus Aenigmarchaeota archaeon]|nr:hypothetical protein [Candidatus Aenigmarchaeota archaeon]